MVISRISTAINPVFFFLLWLIRLWRKQHHTTHQTHLAIIQNIIIIIIIIGETPPFILFLSSSFRLIHSTMTDIHFIYLRWRKKEKNEK